MQFVSFSNATEQLIRQCSSHIQLFSGRSQFALLFTFDLHMFVIPFVELECGLVYLYEEALVVDDIPCDID